jgi:opacity protein-like surface antigen
MNQRTIGFVVFGAVLALSSVASAQTGGAFGIGPRVTFQTGDAQIPRSSALRIFGGQAKVRLTPSTEIELSADYESRLNTSLTERAKTMPIQASVLYFPVRSVLSPYVLGGIGWYKHSLTQTAPTSAATTASIREMGYHGGVGAELRVGKRMAIHADYRYNHIRFGGTGSSATTAAQPEKQATSTSIVTAATSAVSLLPKLSAIQESLKRSNQGGMWNWGLTVFF